MQVKPVSSAFLHRPANQSWGTRYISELLEVKLCLPGVTECPLTPELEYLSLCLLEKPEPDAAAEEAPVEA